MSSKVVKLATKDWVNSQNYLKPSDTLSKETLQQMQNTVANLVTNYGTALSTTEEILNG